MEAHRMCSSRVSAPPRPHALVSGASSVFIGSSEALLLVYAIKPFSIHLYFLDPFIYRKIFL